MKITNIEIKNFRAFYGTYQIALTKKGKNLLVYGRKWKWQIVLVYGPEIILWISVLYSY